MTSTRNAFRRPARWAAAALLAASPAFAAPSTPVYMGATLGAVAVKASDYDIERHQRGDADLSTSLFGGVTLGAVPIAGGWPISVEFGYQDIAHHRIRYRTGGGDADLDVRGHSVYVGAVVEAPLSARFALYGKLGAARNSVKGRTPAGQTVIGIDGNATGVLAGFGGLFRITDKLEVRAELTSLGKTSDNSRGGTVGAGLVYRF